MTKLEQLQQAGLPVIANECNEELGQWSFELLTDEQWQTYNLIMHGEPPTEQVFTVPLIAPEFIVASPKPKTDPAEALAHAQALALIAHKPLAEIVLNLMVVIADMDKRLKK